MEYLIVFALQVIGIGLHVMQKVAAFDRQYPEKKMREIFITFWEEDWNTVFISALVMCLNLVVHFIIARYAPALTLVNYYHLYAFGGAFVMGYAGQRLIYNYLGTAEKFLDKKVNDTLK